MICIMSQFHVGPDSMAADNFTLSFPPGSRQYIGIEDHLGDILGLDCKNLDGKPFIFVSAVRLRPHESRDLILTRTRLLPATIRPEISVFSTNPEPFVARSTQTAIPHAADPELDGCYGYNPFPAMPRHGKNEYGPVPFGIRLH